MMTAADVYRAVDMLKEMCDPRGHELLDAIGDTLIQAINSVQRLDALFDIAQAGKVVELRGRMTPEDFLADNDRWSRKAPTQSAS